MVSPRHIVITGASSGIGAALAERYAGNETRLSLLGRNADRLNDVAKLCSNAGSLAVPQVGDVTDSAFMARWLQDCDTQMPVDLMIANAGIGGHLAMASSHGETRAAVHEIFSTNVLGVMNSVTPLIPRMMERQSGHLVLMSSLAGYLGLPDAPAYSGSKAAIRIYANGLHCLLAPRGVRVSVICPGFVKTPMSESLPGTQPFLWSVDRAARHIAIKISQGKHEIVFPWQLAMVTRIATMLPSFILDPLLRHVRHSQTNT